MALLQLDIVTIWFVRKVFLPLLILSLCLLVIKVQLEAWRCNKIAEAHGYLEGKLVPGNRGVGKACICQKKKMPDGTVDKNVKLIINLD